MQARTVSRRGKSYRQDTGNIGKQNARRRKQAAPDTSAPGQMTPKGIGTLESILRAVDEIAGCTFSPVELAGQLAARPDREQLISNLEKANEFLELCAAEAKCAGVVQQRTGDSSLS